MTTLGRALIVSLVVLVCGCAAPQKTVTQGQIDGLAQQISGLDAGVDPAEAARAADISYRYSLQLAQEYNVTDNPIVHNAKVNSGWRERGICVHWAEDLEKRLNAEEFKTLQVHRAIADGKVVMIDHSTAIISARGAPFDAGIVLDPWRQGGLLFWSPTLEDDRYFWEPQMTVLARKYQEKNADNPPAYSD